MKTTLQVFNYNDNPISFELGNGQMMINATQMAKYFGKRPVDYLRLPSTSELVQAIVRKSHNCDNQIVRTERVVLNMVVALGCTKISRLISHSGSVWISVSG